MAIVLSRKLIWGREIGSAKEGTAIEQGEGLTEKVNLQRGLSNMRKPRKMSSERKMFCSAEESCYNGGTDEWDSRWSSMNAFHLDGRN